MAGTAPCLDFGNTFGPSTYFKTFFPQMVAGQAGVGKDRFWQNVGQINAKSKPIQPT
jgi:hypothetical protein